MTKRNPLIVLVLFCITFGIYPILWTIKTRDELVAKGADIPAWFFMFIPLLNLLFFWKFWSGAEKVFNGKVNGIMSFLFPILGVWTTQNAMNEVADAGGAGVARVA